MKGWDSKKVIGTVHLSFIHFKERESERGKFHGDPLWHAYYNGWLEGRLEMLRQIEDENRREK